MITTNNQTISCSNNQLVDMKVNTADICTSYEDEAAKHYLFKVLFVIVVQHEVENTVSNGLSHRHPQ